MAPSSIFGVWKPEQRDRAGMQKQNILLFMRTLHLLRTCGVAEVGGLSPGLGLELQLFGKRRFEELHY